MSADDAAEPVLAGEPVIVTVNAPGLTTLDEDTGANVLEVISESGTKSS